jgi:hypothetical protein
MLLLHLVSKKDTMKGLLFSIACLVLFSCTKDRFTPKDPVEGEEQLMYFWDFNDANPANISGPTFFVGSNSLNYSGTWDYTDGTLLNAPEGTPAGTSLRLRNPAERFLITLSTKDFEQIKMSFAVMRTSNGAQENQVSYSLDGISFYNAGIEPSKYVVGIDFQIIQIDFSSVQAINNQDQVFIAIDFFNGAENTTGNNRFDNLSFFGKEQ